MQCGLTGTHGGLCFSSNFRLNAAAANCSRDLAICEEDHLGAALLRSGPTRVRDSRDNDAFATFAGFIDHTIEIAQRVRRHWLGFVFCLSVR